MIKWKVSSNVIDGKKFFRAYRLIDENAVDHSGNREYYGDYNECKEDVQRIVDKLNAEKKC